ARAGVSAADYFDRLGAADDLDPVAVACGLPAFRFEGGDACRGSDVPAIELDPAGAAFQVQTDRDGRRAPYEDSLRATDQPDRNLAAWRSELQLDPVGSAGHVEPAQTDLVEVGGHPQNAPDDFDRPRDGRVEEHGGEAFADVERQASVLDEHSTIADPDLGRGPVEPG